MANKWKPYERNWISWKNNAIRTNYVIAKIEQTQQNCKWRLCSERDETINRLKSEYSKLAQKEYKTVQDWGMVIHWILCHKRII